MGLSHERHFQTYHRVLNRVVWCSRQASRILLNQISAVFAPSGVLVMGIDDTIERCQGGASQPKASIEIQYARRIAILSKSGGCAGLA